MSVTQLNGMLLKVNCERRSLAASEFATAQQEQAASLTQLNGMPSRKFVEFHHPCL
ncbi:hypothetical protein KDW_13460 [Dictyobacter vulcani]|uniref:Uncharacterized protein n=1 Tax=Dictyobacter vulcani TaxID=2607529 RepID=A0A5J4KDM8_9CHLR|nr:hypothetical protein KDW_13460 [Dictyobacter vulcani]